MTLKSLQYEIWRRLAVRFALEDQPPTGGGARLATTIQPVTSADDLLAVPKFVTETNSAATTGSTILLTVPKGKRWKVLAFKFTRNAGDRTVTIWGVSDAAGTVDVEQFTAANVFRSGILPSPLVMDEAHTLKATLGAGTTDGAWAGTAWVLEENAF